MNIQKNYKYILILLVLNVFFEVSFVYSQNKEASFVFAKKLYKDKLYDLAAEQFHQFADYNFEHAKAPESLLMAGKCYLKTGNYHSAKKELIELITKYPDARILDEAQFLVAECFEKNNNLLYAAKSYKQVQVFFPKSPLAFESLFKSAQMSYKLKEFDQASENLYHLIEFYPVNKNVNKARLFLAEIFIEQNKYQQATLQLDKLINLTEKGLINASALYKKGYFQLVSGYVQEAQQTFTNVIEKYRTSKNNDIKEVVNKTYNGLAEISRKKELFQQSNDYLIKIHNFQKHNKYVVKVADNYYSLKDYSKAIEFYKLISENKLDNTFKLEANFQLGNCFSYMQNYIESITVFDRVIESLNDSLLTKQKELCKKAYIKNSENYTKNNNPNLAVKYLKDYLNKFTKAKNVDQIVFKICTLYTNEVGDIERAIRSYYDFLDNYPSSRFIDDAQYNLANCFEKKGEYGVAVKEYQKLINNFPASDYGETAEKRIKYIKNYFSTNQDILKKFNTVFKQLTIAQNEMMSSFELGLTYFKEFKDYSSAKELFKKSYLEKKNTGIPVDKIIYYLGRSYQLLGEKEELENKFQINYLDSAFYDYDILLGNIPKSEFADDAAFYQIEILEKRYYGSKDSLNFVQLKNKMTNFIYNYNKSEYIDNVNLMLGNLLLEVGINTAVDSMDIHHSLTGILSNSADNSIINKADFSLASFYFKIGEMSLAEDRLKSIINNHPKSSMICEAYSLLAQLNEKMGEYDNAVYYYKYILQNFYYSKCSDETTIKIANLLMKQNKFSEAESYYQKLYNLIESYDHLGINNPNDDIFQEILFNIAYISINEKNDSKATGYFNEYITKYPIGKYTDIVLFELGKIHFGNDVESQKKAIDYFKRIDTDFSYSPLADSALERLGDIYLIRNEYEIAIKYYADYIRKNNIENDYSAPFSNKIICLYRLGKTNQADNEVKIFKKQYKDKKHLIANILLEKGDYYIKTKKLKLAEKIFKDVRSDYKNTHNGAKAEYLLGKLNFILNKDEEALEIMSKLIDKYPKDKILADVYMTLGNFYYLQAKQIEHALLSYKKATEQEGIENTKLKNALNNLIKCYADLRLREQALTTIRKYLKRYPTADDIFEKKVLMGILYYELKEFDMALNLLKKLKFEADIKNEPRIQYWIGECYFGKGEFKKAVSEYLKVVYLSKPTKLNWRVTAQYQAGIAYVKAGEPDKAIQLFDKIILEQGADSVFGKPAKKKVDEISVLMQKNQKEK
jgi:TolA-binding protein